MENIKALLVDDEEDLISTMAERLEYRDVDAEVAFTGAEALEKVEKNKYDVLVIDLKMPGLSGSDLIRTIQKTHPDVPILLMTGHGMNLENLDIPPGVSNYLPKPVDINDLIDKMHEAIDKR